MLVRVSTSYYSSMPLNRVLSRTFVQDCQTPLMVAAKNDKTAAVQKLLELGADVESKDNVSGGKKLLLGGETVLRDGMASMLLICWES